MVQILPNRSRPSRSEEMTNALKAGMELYSQQQQQKKQSAQMERENESLMKQGIDLSGVTDPKMRQLYVSSALQGANARQLQEIKELAKDQRILEKQNFLSQLLGNQQPEKQEIAKSLSSGDENLPLYEKQDQSGKSFMDQEFGMQGENSSEKSGFDASKLTDSEIAQATALDPQLGMALQRSKDVSLREKREEIKSKENLEAQERKNRTKKEAAFFKFNEPKLAEIANAERRINVDNARFTRLEDLFQDDSKFPSPILAALVTKDGAINDVAYSQLSPDAQEAVKLIIDSTSGIKDTYGARVTNFDLQTYLRKLPSLMTSPEGRRRVIRDLKSINDINQVYNEGIQEIFDNAGGSDQISFSEAERRFKKEYGSELQRKIDKFITPEQSKFKTMPNPKQYLGKKLKNSDTGEVFISDGTQWKPFKGE